MLGIGITSDGFHVVADAGCGTVTVLWLIGSAVDFV